jgi:hypothetical protein
VEPSLITDPNQACFAKIAAPIFQEEGDGLLPLVTRCKNILPKGCFQNKGGRKKERVKCIGFHLQT